MHKFWVLVRLNLHQMLCSISGAGGRAGKKKAAKGIGGILLLGGLSLYLSTMYSALLGKGLQEMGQLPTLLLLMSVMAAALCTVFTLFAAQGVIFGGRDNDLMLSMPIDSFTLLLSRVMALYLENLLCTALMLLPAAVVYLVYGGGGGLLTVLRTLLSALLLALLPTVLSLILGFFLSWVSSKFRKKALLTNLLYFFSFAVLMVAAFRMSFSLGGGEMDALAGIETVFEGWGLCFLLTRDAICGSPLAILWLALLCVLPFLLVVWLFSRQYKRILTGLLSQSARSDYRLGKVAFRGQRRALLTKEAGRFFGTPIYFFNAGFGLLMLPALAVLAAIFRGKIHQFLAPLTQQLGPLPIPLLLLICVGFFLATVGITASSVSLEGRQVWILKEAPVSVHDIFLAKAGFQMLLCLPCVVLSVVLLAFAFGLTVLDGAGLLVAALAFSSAVAPMGLLINLFFPKMDAMNDTTVVKNSASALLSLLFNGVLLAIACLICHLVRGTLGDGVGLLAAGLVCAGAAGGTAAVLRGKGQALFRAL